MLIIRNNESNKAPSSLTGGVDLVFRDIHVEIDGTKILQNVSGTAKQGELLAIMGPSGQCIVHSVASLCEKQSMYHFLIMSYQGLGNPLCSTFCLVACPSRVDRSL